MKVEVVKNKATFKVLEGDSVTLEIFDKPYEITTEGVEIEY